MLGNLFCLTDVNILKEVKEASLMTFFWFITEKKSTLSFWMSETGYFPNEIYKSRSLLN